MIIALVVLTIIFIYILITYNSFITSKNKIRQAISGIEIYLAERFNLMPNLVECIKAYMSYEKETFSKIAKMRESYIENKNLKDRENLNNEYNKILKISEKYPKLRTNEQFLNLQNNLSKIESKLQFARKVYNLEVTRYNNKIQTFPNNIIAKIFKFKEEELFKAEEEEKSSIIIDGEV